jgi:hypothetical protein
LKIEEYIRIKHERGLLLMTYNFDPDQWYEKEIAFLENSYKCGKISEKEFKQAIEELNKRHEDMWNRIDGTYQIPH